MINQGIKNQFTGVLKLDSKHDENPTAFFSVDDHLVTVIPFEKQPIGKTKINDTVEFLQGFTQYGDKVAFMSYGINYGVSIPIDLGAGSFSSSIIFLTKGTGKDIDGFKGISFRGGIVDCLYSPSLALDTEQIDQNHKNKIFSVPFKSSNSYTNSYEATINGETFKIILTIDTSDSVWEIGKIPDLKHQIFSTMRFQFDTQKSLCEVIKYYDYAKCLFGFCALQNNIGFEMRLYSDCNWSNPIMTKFFAPLEDYAEDNNNASFRDFISLNHIGDKLPALFKELVESKRRPKLSFLPMSNKEQGSINSYKIIDILGSLEKEYKFSESKTILDADLKRAAKTLHTSL